MVKLLTILLLLTACMESPEYTCTFERIPGIYTTTHIRLVGKGLLIIVEKDGIDYAFPRNQIKVCYKGSLDEPNG